MSSSIAIPPIMGDMPLVRFRDISAEIDGQFNRLALIYDARSRHTREQTLEIMDARGQVVELTVGQDPDATGLYAHIKFGEREMALDDNAMIALRDILNILYQRRA